MRSNNKIPDIDKELIKSANLFPVVGIGASAGGLDAFKKLLKAIPEDSGMAYVLVQHLDPKHESMLPEILQKVTKIPVLEITDDIKVHPDHIYVIPSNKIMVATDGVLLLAPRPEKSKTERNLPIDLFFSSLAEVHQEHAIGVVLSGTASDGTQGLKAIKEQGGITFAQDEASAEYEGMPHSAAEAGVVDFILPPEEIPKKLLEVTSKIVLSDEALQNIPKQDEDVFKQILSLLRIRKGVDFTYYKQTTIRRRILRRMVVNKHEEPADYLQFLRGSTAEQDLLYQDMLIPVTSFFRDKKVFEDLCNNIFPVIIKNKIPGEITRIWVAGCSTGQEAYSIAICFKEFLGDNHERIQIFGTDLSEPAITKARTGMYEKSELDSVSPERLKEFFTKSSGGYQVNKSIRDMCVFAHHNFLKDPPFGKMDCISCRNVLIYMEPYLQKKALTTFHYALNPKGFLLLGKSETTGGVPDLFAAVEKNDKLYTRKDVPGRFIQVTSQRSEQILSNAINPAKNEAIRNDFQKTADDILLTKYTPAGVVVNETMDIVHFRGNTANYLEQAPGKPSHNLLMMAKNGLGFELRNILHKAKTDKVPVIKENIPLSINGQLLHISIEAVPLPNTLEPYYLILFHDNNLNDTDGAVIPNRKKNSAKTKKEEKDIQIQLLEQELAQAREDMRSITEDQEASNEELQSANEELLSGSEELQSLNEELETSKEELQSTNEELTVLNHELINLNEQVTDARNYSESIVATLYQPLLVLDKHLRVKTANHAFYKTFKVNEQETEGVLIYDLGNRQWNIPELRTLLEEILPQKKQITDYEVTHNFLSIGERTILLSALEITREKKEEKLILLSIEDITEKKLAQKKLQESEHSYNMMLMQSPFAFAVLKGKDMVITLANDSIKNMWGKGTEVEGKPFLEVLPELKEQQFPSLLNEVFTTGIPYTSNESLVRLQRNGKMEDAYFNFAYQPYRDADETITGVVIIATEVTPLAILNKKIKASEEKFKLLVLQAPVAICVLRGKDYVVEVINKGMNEMWDKTVEETLNKPLFDVLPEVRDQGIKQLLDTVYDTGKRYAAEEFSAKIKRNDKLENIFVKFVYEPMCEADGTVSGVMVVANEITEQVLSRKKVEESKERFEAAVSAVEGIVWTNNGKGEMQGEQIGWSSLTGQSYEEYQGYGWTNAIHPDDVKATIEAWKEAVRTGTNFIFEHRVKLKNGNWGYFSVKAIPLINADELVWEWVGVHIDITHQREADSLIQYRKALLEAHNESSLDGILLVDTKGKILSYNHRFMQLWSMPQHIVDANDDEAALLHSASLMISPESFLEKIQYLYQNPNELAIDELEFKDGKIVMRHGYPVLAPDGTKYAWSWIFRDITEQKETDKKLNETILLAEKSALNAQEEKTKALEAALIATEAVKAKQQFLSNMSHEIRTPMNAIIGFTKVILKTELSPKQREYLNAIKLSGNSLIVLINDILDLAKVDAGKMTFEEIPFKLSNSLLAITNLFETKIEEKNLELSTEYDNRIPQVLLGDPVRLHQILLNLISNAVKFTSVGKITVRTHLLKEKETTAEIQFTIADTGIGIAADKINEVFENFNQANSETSRLYGGTGLGLAIVKKIVEAQGSQITVNSKLNEGTSFSFSLVFKKTTEPVQEELGLIEIDADLKNIKVLVAEDMVLNQLLMKTILDDFGFERDVVSNGVFAIEKLKVKSYDIILMDLQMPEMNGFETTNYIRNTLHLNLPIIALTADVTTVDLEKCKAAGMNDYIAKPVDEKLLYSKIVGLVKKIVTPAINTLPTATLKLKQHTATVNLTYLKDHTKLNADLLVEMIEIYLQQTPPLLISMQESFETKNWVMLYAAAHKLIPSFSIMGINEQYENITKKIQDYAKYRVDAATDIAHVQYAETIPTNNDIAELIEQVQQICQKACVELTNTLHEIK